jgi:hypothetical protein
VSHDVAGAIAPVDAAVQPVLTAVAETAESIPPAVLDTIFGGGGSGNPATLHVPDQVGNLVADGPAATPDASDNAISDASHLASGGVASDVFANTASGLHTTEPVTITVAAADIAASDVSHPPTGTVASDVLANAAPDAQTTEPVTTTAAAANNAISDESHPPTGTVASDVPVNAAPDVQTTEPVTTAVAAADNAANDVSHPADTLLALATATDAPIQVPESATAAPANTEASIHPADVAGDVIDLNDAPPPPANTLFTGTQYTQYGVTLSSNAGTATQDASSVDATSVQHTSAPAVADVQQHAPPPPEIADPTHTTDHHAIL